MFLVAEGYMNEDFEVSGLKTALTVCSSTSIRTYTADVKLVMAGQSHSSQRAFLFLESLLSRFVIFLYTLSRAVHEQCQTECRMCLSHWMYPTLKLIPE